MTMLRDPEMVAKELAALVEEEVSFFDIDIKPLFPNVLVRVLDRNKEGRYGNIILPETRDQPHMRAVVVRTWGSKTFGHITVTSEFNEGDIVLIPFWSGVPCDLNKIDGTIYRVLPENMRRSAVSLMPIYEGASQDKPHIICKIKLIQQTELVRQLIPECNDIFERTKEEDVDIAVRKLLDKYIILPRHI